MFWLFLGVILSFKSEISGLSSIFLFYLPVINQTGFSGLIVLNPYLLVFGLIIEIIIFNNIFLFQVTLWDYDAFESHSFLGEALIDLTQTLLNNQPHVYTLLDMDDDNPIRVVGCLC